MPKKAKTAFQVRSKSPLEARVLRVLQGHNRGRTIEQLVDEVRMRSALIETALESLRASGDVKSRKVPGTDFYTYRPTTRPKVQKAKSKGRKPKKSTASAPAKGPASLDALVTAVGQVGADNVTLRRGLEEIRAKIDALLEATQ